MSPGATTASSTDVVPLSIVLVRSEIAGVEEQVQVHGQTNHIYCKVSVPNRNQWLSLHEIHLPPFG